MKQRPKELLDELVFTSHPVLNLLLLQYEQAYAALFLHYREMRRPHRISPVEQVCDVSRIDA